MSSVNGVLFYSNVNKTYAGGVVGCVSNHIQSLCNGLLKFRPQFDDEVLSPNCIHTACNSIYYLRAAAVCTVEKRKSIPFRTQL